MVRLQGKFDVDHFWEWKGYVTSLGWCSSYWACNYNPRQNCWNDFETTFSPTSMLVVRAQVGLWLVPEPTLIRGKEQSNLGPLDRWTKYNIEITSWKVLAYCFYSRVVKYHKTSEDLRGLWFHQHPIYLCFNFYFCAQRGTVAMRLFCDAWRDDSGETSARSDWCMADNHQQWIEHNHGSWFYCLKLTLQDTICG